MSKLLCFNCGNREVKFNCNILEKSICQYCCDKFQLFQITDSWCGNLSQKIGNELKYKEWKELNKTKCFECEGLIRSENEEINTRPESGIGFELYESPFYKGHKVFSGDAMLLFPKRLKLMERQGCSEPEDYFYLGESYFNNSEYKKALEQFEIIKDEFDDAYFYFLFGKTYYNLGIMALAEENLKKAINSNENYAEAYRRLGDLYRRKKKYEKSIAFYIDAIDVNYMDEDVIDNFSEYSYFGMALSYSKLGLQVKVIDTVNAFLNQAGLYGERIIERWNKFNSSGEQTIDDNIESDKYHFTISCELLTVAYLENDDHPNAERNLKYSLLLDPSNSEITRLEGILIGRKYKDEKLLEYKQLLEDLKSHTEEKLFPQIQADLKEIKDFTLPRVWATLKITNPFDQVKVVTNNPEESVNSFLLSTVLLACRETLEYSPNITPSIKKPAEEDRYTDLLKLILNQRLHFIGWNVETQARGGYTKKIPSDRGGVGERDLVFRCSQGNILALGEALILTGFNQAAINTHVEKIFGYDTTSSNYHFVINWGFSDEPNRVWEDYKKLVVERKVGSFAVINYGSIEDLYPSVNCQGVRSFYTTNHTDVINQHAKVIHIYIDLKNQLKRDIAFLARQH